MDCKLFRACTVTAVLFVCFSLNSAGSEKEEAVSTLLERRGSQLVYTNDSMKFCSGGWCYHIHANPSSVLGACFSIDDMKNYCITNHQNVHSADLASVHDMEINKRIYGLSHMYTEDLNVVIGYHYTDKSQTWTDGSVVNFTNFRSSLPPTDVRQCAAISSSTNEYNNVWEPRICTDLAGLPFVCEYTALTGQSTILLADDAGHTPCPDNQSVPYENFGEIDSPSYGGDPLYHNARDDTCTYLIKVTEGGRVQLTVTEFTRQEYMTDIIDVYDGWDVEDKYRFGRIQFDNITYLNGHENISDSYQVRLEFHRKAKINGSWKIKFETKRIDSTTAKTTVQTNQVTTPNCNAGASDQSCGFVTDAAGQTSFILTILVMCFIAARVPL